MRALAEGRQKQRLRHVAQPLNMFIAQEVYRVLLFSVFLAQAVIARHVPYAGELTSSSCMLSWPVLYARIIINICCTFEQYI